ncbi:YlmC/YmxH family sporulation protein [Serpentinicella alkaliphila]|uniref:YlmC/YmxH family sporulation protein n=1 Tax=Serpentinicella alkaliphila TaxID=1734049 RepID=A0A4R2TB18_9FIRM|nr:YlmC/YmxH family sporulation protein [Serpentinicella alkaliphila]QUH26078.1 YlmC/YmxH family sporulation protein [Serpentinicella alkaliphila]TCP99091.1 YlmC/YmxH family sporulation protein [Serpentinicella alkaliphila]
MIKASDLTQKEVINISDGRRLGLIADLEVDLKKGKITAIIVPREDKPFGLFSKEEDLEVRWGEIKKIGEDVILVELLSNVEINGDRNAKLVKRDYMEDAVEED